MSTISYDQLIIEVTRRCNMGCAHCMRGEAQNVDISFETIDKALSNVKNINSITFTGGEPTLNVPAIRHTLEVCEENGIYVGSFYIVTNGKIVPPDFLSALVDWYSYIADMGGETDMCGLALSHDMYHEDIDPRNQAKLEALSFFSENDKRVDWSSVSLINLGRARTLVHNRRSDPFYPTCRIDRDGVDEYRVEDGAVSLTVNGEFLRSCDYEYDNTEDLLIGRVDDPDWFVKLFYEPEYECA